MKRICVYCVSSTGLSPEYAQASRQLGSFLVRRQLGLVYGGGKVGMMRKLFTAVLKHGGDATGDIPRELWDWSNSRSIGRRT